MRLRETWGESAKGCPAKDHLPEPARSDHVLKPERLFRTAGPVAGHDSLTVPDIAIRSPWDGSQSIRPVRFSECAATVRAGAVVCPVTVGKEAHRYIWPYTLEARHQDG